MTRLFAGTPFDIPPRCDRCGDLEADCKCPPEEKKPEFLPPAKQTAKVRIDRRKHKRVLTLVTGLSPGECDLKNLLSVLQSACGAGGSIQGDQIEIQGEHEKLVRDKLAKLGYRVK